MTKSELIAVISEKTGLPKTNVKAVLNGFEQALGDALSAGDKVSLPGFGTFKVSLRTARKIPNPRSGELMHVPARNVPVFSAGSTLKSRVNGIEES